jgi:glycosyltransferase involved in cell wall biosynthesis
MRIIQIGDMCHVGINIHRGLIKNSVYSKILISSLIVNYEKETGVVFNKLNKYFFIKYIYILYFVALNKADIFHCHGISGIFPFLLRKNFTIHFHGSDLRDFHTHNFFKKIIIKLLCNSAKKIFVSTFDLIDKYIEYGFDEKKLEHIPNSVIVQKTLKKDFCLDGSIKLFCPSSNHWTKGKHLLIKAFKRIEQDFENISLTLIRFDGVENDEINKLVKELSIKNINFIDKIAHKDFINEYLKYDIVLDQFSDLKNYGVITYEALSLGIPAICTLGGNLNKYTNNSPVLPGNSVQSIINSVSQIINNNEFSKIGYQGKEFIVNHNSVEVISKKFINTFSEFN